MQTSKLELKPGDDIRIYVGYKPEPYKGRFLSQTINIITWINERGTTQRKNLSVVLRIEKSK